MREKESAKDTEKKEEESKKEHEVKNNFDWDQFKMMGYFLPSWPSLL